MRRVADDASQRAEAANLVTDLSYRLVGTGRHELRPRPYGFSWLLQRVPAACEPPGAYTVEPEPEVQVVREVMIHDPVVRGGAHA